LKKPILSTLICLIILSCGSRAEYIDGGITKIPIKDNYFKKIKNKHKTDIPNGIDSESLYREIYIMYGVKKYESDINRISVLKFYKNGCVNEFIGIKKSELKDIDLNPEIKGYRGLAYKENDKQFVSFFAPVTQEGNYGLQKNILKTDGDTLFLNDKNTNTIIVYVKDKIRNKNLKYIADW
jgi:hypothetical protein